MATGSTRCHLLCPLHWRALLQSLVSYSSQTWCCSNSVCIHYTSKEMKHSNMTPDKNRNSVHSLKCAAAVFSTTTANIIRGYNSYQCHFPQLFSVNSHETKKTQWDVVTTLKINWLWNTRRCEQRLKGTVSNMLEKLKQQYLSYDHASELLDTYRNIPLDSFWTNKYDCYSETQN